MQERLQARSPSQEQENDTPGAVTRKQDCIHRINQRFRIGSRSRSALSSTAMSSMLIAADWKRLDTVEGQQAVGEVDSLFGIADYKGLDM